jgi:hypothetical protein
MTVTKEYILSLLDARLSSSQTKNAAAKTCISLWLDAITEYATNNKPIEFTPEGSEYDDDDMNDNLSLNNQDEEAVDAHDWTQHSLLKSIWSTDKMFNMTIRACSDPAITIELMDRSPIYSQQLKCVVQKLHGAFKKIASKIDSHSMKASYTHTVKHPYEDSVAVVEFSSLFFIEHMALIQTEVSGGIDPDTGIWRHSVTLTVTNQVYASGMKTYEELMKERHQFCIEKFYKVPFRHSISHTLGKEAV